MYINERFLELPADRRLRIINAGFEVFGSNEYKRASTELIAAKASISKGLLFYYFHNKRSLYLYLAEYAVELIRESVMDSHFNEIDDFFELCEYMGRKKYALMLSSPHIFDFFVRALYAGGEDITRVLNDRALNALGVVYDMLENGGLVRFFTPFRYFAPDMLLEGRLEPLFVGLCLIVSAAALLIAFGRFEARDLNALSSS